MAEPLPPIPGAEPSMRATSASNRCWLAPPRHLLCSHYLTTTYRAGAGRSMGTEALRHPFHARFMVNGMDLVHTTRNESMPLCNKVLACEMKSFRPSLFLERCKHLVVLYIEHPEVLKKIHFPVTFCQMS
jgi:hypothetical protein